MKWHLNLNIASNIKELEREKTIVFCYDQSVYWLTIWMMDSFWKKFKPRISWFLGKFKSVQVFRYFFVPKDFSPGRDRGDTFINYYREL